MAYPTAVNNQSVNPAVHPDIKVMGDIHPDTAAALVKAIEENLRHSASHHTPPHACSAPPIHPGLAMVFVPYSKVPQAAVTDAAPPTAVNPQITDAVTQANVKVLGEAPAMAVGSLYQTISNSVAMAAANAVYAQQQANVIYQAATTQGVYLLVSMDTAVH